MQFTNTAKARMVIKACLVLLAFGGYSRGAEQTRPLMREFIGLNGHTVQFKPDLYQPVARLVRDYHPVDWDLGTNTSEAAPFPFAKNRVDWSRVYGSWTAKEWNVDVCLMFDHMKPEKWSSLEADARAYGKAFAREFGPSGKRKLVESVEIGNEPGNWSDSDYTRIYKAMAEGVREGDSKLKLVTCNLSAGKSGKYDKSAACVARLPELVDVLNVHTYAMLENWPTWRRSFPEDPRLPKYLKDVEDLCRWRDAHAVGKPIWVTEFGYDSSTKTADPKSSDSKWVGVTNEQQAQWLVRSLLVFSAMPVERAYIYFFNDNDKPSFHASSGITRNFQPKPSFHALAQMQRILGNYRFENIVTNEPGHLRIQQYRHGANAAKSIWVVWAPSGTNQSFTSRLTGFPGKLIKVEEMTTQGTGAPASGPVPAPVAAESYDAKLTESPLYLFFEK
jgi:Cellulase (glycosyl hydrolase family 5)